jgi:bifunctional DNA-binding transcriptional regulator/antitoxin component of YhaV-PrlF toxin-antitoxin module
VKLQKVVAYKYGDKTHYKYIITIPEETISELGWKEGSELKDSIKNKSLIIDFVSEPVKKRPKPTESKMSYEEFRDKIKGALQYSDHGMTWTEIRKQLQLEQVVPNNKWVRQMEKDIGLERIKDIRGVVWRVKHV